MMKPASSFSLICMGLMAAVLAAPLAQAHPRQEAETDITYNANTDMVEVVHRFRIADAETALHEIVAPGLDIIQSAEAQAAFGQYVEDRFSIVANGEPLKLTLVGGEIDAGYVWIYEEAPPLPQEGLYVVRHDALMDALPAQTNIVNVRLFDQTQTFILTRTSPWAIFRLDGEDVY